MFYLLQFVFKSSPWHENATTDFVIGSCDRVGSNRILSWNWYSLVDQLIKVDQSWSDGFKQIFVNVWICLISLCRNGVDIDDQVIVA